MLWYKWCQGGGNFSQSPNPSWVLVAELIIKLTQDELIGEKEILSLGHRGLIEMAPKKWPKQAAFILFRQRNNKFVRNWQDKET